jgi:hypothetical protein
MREGSISITSIDSLDMKVFFMMIVLIFESLGTHCIFGVHMYIVE